MFLDDYNEETFKREVRAEAFADGRKEGLADGRKEGREEERIRAATTMILDGNSPISFISKVSLLPEDTIREMAAKLNVKL